jgi:hypothetical protein
MDSTRKAYERPELRHYGSVSRLTQKAGSGVDHSHSGMADKPMHQNGHGREG